MPTAYVVVGAISSVWPSGGVLAAISAPILPPAPGRLSTTACWPHASVSFWPTMRESRSAAPPGGKGTMIRMGRTGYACPELVEVDCAAAQNAQPLSRSAQKVLAGVCMAIVLAIV